MCTTKSAKRCLKSRCAMYGVSCTASCTFPVSSMQQHNTCLMQLHKPFLSTINRQSAPTTEIVMNGSRYVDASFKPIYVIRQMQLLNGREIAAHSHMSFTPQHEEKRTLTILTTRYVLPGRMTGGAANLPPRANSSAPDDVADAEAADADDEPDAPDDACFFRDRASLPPSLSLSFSISSSLQSNQHRYGHAAAHSRSNPVDVCQFCSTLRNRMLQLQQRYFGFSFRLLLRCRHCFPGPCSLPLAVQH